MWSFLVENLGHIQIIRAENISFRSYGKQVCTESTNATFNTWGIPRVCAVNLRLTNFTSRAHNKSIDLDNWKKARRVETCTATTWPNRFLIFRSPKYQLQIKLIISDAALVAFCSFFLKKLITAQSVNKFTAFYGSCTSHLVLNQYSTGYYL